MAKKYARQPRRLIRKPAIREERQCILIVCEGEKTECNYFRRLRKELRLASVDIEVKHRGSAAFRAVEYARELKGNRANSLFSDYDKTWCVVDVECPPQKSLDKAVIHAKNYQIDLIMSNPCFEYWLLLHFEKTSSHMTAKKTLQRLKKHLPGYSKSDDDWFRVVHQETEEAIKRAKAILKENGWEMDNLKECNASTHVHKIVGDLLQVK